MVSEAKTKVADGYEAIQLGFVDAAEKKATKPQAGHFKKYGGTTKKYLKEFRLDDMLRI